jgi:hypothetical protein
MSRSLVTRQKKEEKTPTEFQRAVRVHIDTTKRVLSLFFFFSLSSLSVYLILFRRRLTQNPDALL